MCVRDIPAQIDSLAGTARWINMNEISQPWKHNLFNLIIKIKVIITKDKIRASEV